MEKRTDSNLYTVLFAIGMVIVVGAVLAITASSLKERITKNKEVEKKQNILYVMGVNENDATNAKFISTDKVKETFAKYVTQQLVFENGLPNPDDKAYLIEVKKEKAKKNPSERRLPLFIGNKDGTTFYIIPIYGKGLWNAIWGYVALNEQMIVQGAYFDHTAETPGLGANIKQRFFMDDFIGEHLLDSSSNFKGITVSKSNADPKNLDKTDHEVDAIAGATITGDGVSAMIKSDIALYVPYFKSLNRK